MTFFQSVCLIHSSKTARNQFYVSKMQAKYQTLQDVQQKPEWYVPQPTDLNILTTGNYRPLRQHLFGFLHQSSEDSGWPQYYFKPQFLFQIKHNVSPLEHQLVNGVEGNNCSLFWESNKTHIYGKNAVTGCWNTWYMQMSLCFNAIRS